MPGPENTMRVAIVGGGPAGLSMAKFLSDYPQVSATVFEAEPQVGGKSWTFAQAGVVCEMGTCYATRADIHVRKWFKQLGLTTGKLGSATVDGTEYFQWAKQGPGGSLPLEVLRYLRATHRLNTRLKQRPQDPDVLAEAAMPVLDWLRARNLPRMERLHYRAVTNMGYGRLDETPAIQALRWVDKDLIISGRLNDFLMPQIGWTGLWQALAETLDVRVSSPVTGVSRAGDGVEITVGGETLRFDKVICAIPVDDFTAMTDRVTENEAAVNDAVRWNGYSTTLMAVRDWFTTESVRSFEGGIMLDAAAGKLLSARFEATSDELGGNLYVLNQLSAGYSRAELNEIAEADIRADGGVPVRALLTKFWKYFAQYSSEAVRAGLLQRLQDMQGEANTYYTGATFSHEAVSKITRFNDGLARTIARGAAQ